MFEFMLNWILLFVIIGFVMAIFKGLGKLRDRFFHSEQTQQSVYKQVTAIGDQLQRIEERLGNLETLVLDEEKRKDFDRAL